MSTWSSLDLKVHGSSRSAIDFYFYFWVEGGGGRGWGWGWDGGGWVGELGGG